MTLLSITKKFFKASIFSGVFFFTTAHAENTIEISPDTLGFGINIEDERVAKAREIREAWVNRGGRLLGKSYGLGFNMLDYSSTIDMDPLNTRVSLMGYGLGIDIGRFLVNFRPPVYDEGVLSNYSASKIGVDAEFRYTKTELRSTTSGRIGNQFIHETTETESYQYQLNIVGNVGYFWGIGSNTITPLGWRGWEIGLHWRPTLIMTTPEEGDTTTDFNPRGFSVDFAIGRKLSTSLKEIVPEPYSILSFFFLPPVDDDMPFFLSVNFKRLIY